MDPEPSPPDLVLDIYYNGDLIRSVHFGPATFTNPTADDAAAVTPPGDRRIERLLPCVWLPTDGRLRLRLDLRHPPPGDGGTTGPLVTSTSFRFDPAGRIVASIDPLGNRTTTVYDNSGNVVGPLEDGTTGSGGSDRPSEPPDEPPDEPHITH